MSDIVSFLRARLDEDADIAREAGYTTDGEPAPWSAPCNAVENGYAHDGECRCCRVEGDNITIYDEGGHDRPQAMHISHWDPVRVLAEVEAKRRVLELCEGYIEAGEIQPNSTWNDNAAGMELGWRVLYGLALPYAHHPDYDLAWAAG